MKKRHIIFSALLWSLIFLQGILFLIFGVPVIGAMSAFELAELLGCTLNAAESHECMLLGIDKGDRLYGYKVPLIGSVLTPITFLLSFMDVLVVLNLICLLCWVVRRMTSEKDESLIA